MNYFLAVLAGAIQGLTEFLPISSTGHLIIFENIFGISQDSFGLAFDASLHIGTLLAIGTFFFKDYLKIFKLRNKMLVKLIIGTIPAVIAGNFFEKQIETTLRQLPIVAAALILFSIVIIFAEKTGQKRKKSQDIKTMDALIIGAFQALALIPGISRSGSTISGGLFLGLKRQEAAKFAFILSGPVIAGAGLKKFIEVITSNPEQVNLSFFVIGILSSFIFGYLTIKYFIKYLSTNNLYPFVIYRILAGAIILLAVSKL